MAFPTDPIYKLLKDPTKSEAKIVMTYKNSMVRGLQKGVMLIMPI